MTLRVTDDEIRALRMRAQLLASAAGDAPTGSDAPVTRIARVTRSMLALQGQDWRASHWALGQRALDSGSAPIHKEDVLAAFNAGKIVRSWPMRGTIHVLAAEDIGWLQRLAARRPLAGAARRRQMLGIDDSTLTRLVDTSLEALRGRPLTREELSRHWTEAGISWRPNWRYHVIWWLCQNGLAVFGPTDGPREPRLVLTSEWITAPHTPDDPLRELAERYALGRGPVHEKDLAWWSGLGIREVRQGLERAGEHGALVRMQRSEVPGAAGALWVAERLLDGIAAERTAPEWRLLAAFDEHLLGYTLRDAHLDPQHFDRIVPGRSGIFLPTVVHRGRVIGTWSATNNEPAQIHVVPLPGAHIAAADLAEEAQRWRSFHGREFENVQIALDRTE